MQTFFSNLGHMDLFEATLCRFLGVDHDTDLAQLPMAALLEQHGLASYTRQLHAQPVEDAHGAKHSCATVLQLSKLDDGQLRDAGLDASQVRPAPHPAVACSDRASGDRSASARHHLGGPVRARLSRRSLLPRV